MTTIKEVAEKIEGQLEKLSDKMDGLSEKIFSIERNVDRNTISLEEHIRRTNLLETQVGSLKQKHEDCPAVKAHSAKTGMIAIVRDITVITAAILAVIQLFNILSH